MQSKTIKPTFLNSSFKKIVFSVGIGYMSKAAGLARVSAKASFDVLWGLIVSTVISAVGTIFIARLLGSDQYGLYTIVVTVPLLIGILRDMGVNFAMVRYTAQYRAEERVDEIRSIFLSGIIFEITAGIIFSAVSFGLSNFIATNVFSRPAIAPIIQIASLSILAGGLVNGATAAFTGYETMTLNSVMVIAQSIFKTAIIIGLVILGLGASGAIIGFTVSTFIAGAIGVVLIWTIYRHLPKPVSHKLQIKAYLTTMLTYCLPLSLATIITTILPQFYAFLLPVHYTTSNVMIGNYGVAMNFVVLVTFFSMPVLTMMFPAFSKLDAKKDKEALKNVFQYSVKYASLLVVPATTLVMCLSKPAVETLFGTTYNTAALFLALLAIQYLYTTFGNLSLRPLLNGQDKTGYVMKLALLSGVIGFPLGYFAIMAYGVLGLILAVLVSTVPSTLIGLRYVNKTFGISVDWTSSARILVSSGIAGGATYLIISLLSFPSWVLLLIGIAAFIIILVPAALLTKSITKQDIANLKDMTSSLGSIGKLLTRILDLLEKLMKTLNREKL